jgi:hypothetical protein
LYLFCATYVFVGFCFLLVFFVCFSIVAPRFNDLSNQRSAPSATVARLTGAVLVALIARESPAARHTGMFSERDSFVIARFDMWSWNEELTTALNFYAKAGASYVTGRRGANIELACKCLLAVCLIY